MAYEALYRRYRPSRFQDAFFGQEHVVAALRNAVEKALNCTDLQGGEPCNACDSCQAFQTNSSYDLHELDAASNNGVDAMRDLIGKVALGSPGRTKVYILDEVHMLSSGAENALLKTLEEPPPHVVFVLCTTEPNKVVPTIRSRTQHLEFSLLSAGQVGELVDYIVGDAGLELTPEDRSYVVRAGGGSARDTLSALDQVIAAGGAPQGGEHLEALFQALVDRDANAALTAIDGALHAGRDAAGVATALLHELRTVFLAAMKADLGYLPEAEAGKAVERAAAMPPARITRAVEMIGASIIEMRQAPDPRVDLEVAIMRLTRPDLDTNPAALVERLEAIEGQLAGGAPIAAAPAAAAQAPAAQPAVEPVAVVEPASEPTSEPAPQAQQPAATTQPGMSPGKRGAAIARAALAEQAAQEAAGDTVPAQPPQAQAPAAQAPQQAAADTSPAAQAPAAAAPAAPASTGKTLADVRRERQAAAQAASGAADTGDASPDVQAATAARRDRQAAAQAANVAAQPASEPQQVPNERPVPNEPSAPSEPQQAAQAAPVQEPPAQAAPAQEAPVDAAPIQEPPAQAVPVQEPPAQAVPVQEAPAQAVPVQEAPAQAPPAAGAIPTKDELQAMWQGALEKLSGRVRSRFAAGHFVDSTADSAMFGLPNPVHRDRCQEERSEVDQALAAHFGRPIPLELVVDLVEEEPSFFASPPSGGAGAVAEVADAGPEEEEIVDVHDLVDATGDIPSAQDRVMNTFEGSTLLEDPPNQPPNR